MPRDFEYERENATPDDQSDDQGIKCKNHEVCGTVLPKWWYECKGRYTCTSCDDMFCWRTEPRGKGALEFRDEIECIICLDTKRGVSQPRCSHFACIDCFKRCYYGPEDEPQPEFPYPEKEEEFDMTCINDDDIERWIAEYPLVAEHLREHDEWEVRRSLRYHQEANLHCCPLCRI